MDTQLLIHTIVRQTTVLIASLSTAAGLRAPLAHLADQVFLEVAREIEAQGVSRKVVADMFGLALRGYQKRMQRLVDSKADQRVTLWSTVLHYVADHGPVQRQEVFRRFRYDEETQVAAVLSDLVASRVLQRDGRGPDAAYYVTPEADYYTMLAGDRHATAAWLVWVSVYRNPHSSLAEICARTSLEPGLVESSLATLMVDGRVTRRTDEPVVRYLSQTLTVPVGQRQGWEAAVLDHFQAVCTAIALKTRSRDPISSAADTTGGATLGFDLHADHPYAEQVHGLLQRVRADVNALWSEVRAYNAANPVAEDAKTRVVFYMGQYVQEHEPPGVHDGTEPEPLASGIVRVHDPDDD